MSNSYGKCVLPQEFLHTERAEGATHFRGKVLCEDRVSGAGWSRPCSKVSSKVVTFNGESRHVCAAHARMRVRRGWESA